MSSFPLEQREDSEQTRQRVLGLLAGEKRGRREVEAVITDLSAYRLWAEVRRRENPHSLADENYIQQLNELLGILRDAYRSRDGR